MQVSCGMDTKVSQEVIVRRIEKVFGINIQRPCAMQKECQVIEGHLLSDHIHLLISIPPKYSVSQAIGYLKGKSAIQIARTYMGRKKNFTGQHFWARGYFVSTVGADEETIRDYIKRQENEDRRLDQLSVFEE